MKDEKEQWIDDVINSMKGSQRAKPNTDLFNKINNQIQNQGAKIIPMNQWRISIAAAVAILILNIFVLRNYLIASKVSNENISLEETSPNQIISDYNIYD